VFVWQSVLERAKVELAEGSVQNQAKTTEQFIAELQAMRQQCVELQGLASKLRESEAKLVHLASFPEQNPNLVIETDLAGHVTYLNPVAQSCFPNLWEEGFAHPMLVDLDAISARFQEGKDAYVARELDLGSAVYEQKICFTPGDAFTRIRIFAHDVTARKQAEKAIQGLAKRVVYAQEEERQRISRELHDEAGQALTALKISLQLMQADLPRDVEALRQNFEEAVGLVDTTRERIRLLAHGLRPPALDTVGLNLTLEDFCRHFAHRTSLTIDYHGMSLPDLPDAVNICLYRFLQEALTNVARHAQATQVAVQLQSDTHTVCLSVVDNGCGFVTEPWTAAGRQAVGLGLVGMQERLALLGGWLHIESVPGHTTRLVASVPVEKRV